MLEQVAPPFTARRVLAKIAAGGVREPGRLRQRLNLQNLRDLRRFRQATSRCNVCGHVGPLLFEMPDLGRLREHHIGVLRETLRCGGCHSKMRDRTLAAGLLSVLAERHGLTASTIEEVGSTLPAEVRILDTDAAGRLSRRLGGSAGYVRSLFHPDRADGESLGEDRLVNVNLERMPFPDDRFDVILTTEVMEHVRHLGAAHREIGRCLAPGGVYLFTVPYDPLLETTLDLIDPVTDEPLVLPLHLHGDPGMRESGIKSYRVFGRDILETLHAHGLTARFAPVHDPGIGVFDGDLFMATAVGD